MKRRKNRTNANCKKQRESCKDIDAKTDMVAMEQVKNMLRMRDVNTTNRYLNLYGDKKD